MDVTFPVLEEKLNRLVESTEQIAMQLERIAGVLETNALESCAFEHCWKPAVYGKQLCAEHYAEDMAAQVIAASLEGK